MLNLGKLLAIKLKNSYGRVVQLLGSISAALSCLVCVPPREERLTRPVVPLEEERGLLSQTAAGDRAYTAVSTQIIKAQFKRTNNADWYYG